VTIDGRRDDEAREQAIDPARSFIVQAPAGSGKTSLLTLRYLRLLATVERPEEIVAITFTRKAASEMRHRVVRALSLATRPLAPDAQPHERDLYALAQRALAHSRARRWDLERNPSRLHVQTIDGLNHWLAQRLPLASRISLSASLVDDARPLYREAGRRLVAALESEDARAAPLERLARTLDHDPAQLAALVADMLGSREVWLPKLFRDGERARLRASVDALLRAALETELGRIRTGLGSVAPSSLFAVVRAAAAAGGPASPLAVLGQSETWPPARAESAGMWRAWAELLLTASKDGTLRRKVDAGQGFLPATAGADWKSLKQRMQSLLAGLAESDGFARSLARVRCLPPPGLTDGQWERLAALLDVLPHAVAELVALFAERRSLDHAAVAAAARDALRDDASPTDLALALDYRIRHLLVDEYQDTSPAQERLLALLLAGWQPGDGRTLFCVGDPMQSIYAFREADVTLFLQAAREGIGGVRLEPLRLGRNFRSDRAIVDWVNAAFGALLPAEDDFERGAVRYTPAEPVREDSPRGGVRVHALLDYDAREMGESVARIAAEVLAQAGGPGRPSIAVLVRGRTSLPPVISALRRHGIDFRGIELESLADRAAIRDLVALAKAMLHAGDRTAWLSVLRAPWCGVTLADLHALAGDDPQSTVGALMADANRLERLSRDGSHRLVRLRDALAAAIEARGRRSLGGWVRSAWLTLGGPATVEDPSDLANAELLFCALDRLESEAGAWPENLDLDGLVENIKASPVGREDAPVQIMTIHKAKGLEFDVVIVPDMQRQPPSEPRRLLYWTTVATAPGQRGIVLGSRSDQEGDGEAADALETWMRRLEAERAEFELGRVAYVAVTRARRALHLVGSVVTKSTDDGAVIQKPRPGSLLRFFWPALSREFERALAARDANAASKLPAGRPRLGAPPLRRLPANWAAPAPEPLPQAAALRILGEPTEAVRPDFDWAGTIAKAVGEVVHLELHRLAISGSSRDTLVDRPAAWSRLLRESGVDDAHLPEALARTRAAMAAFRGSDVAARLLDPRATGASSELAVTARIDGAVQGLRIDRTFIDPDGVRWIVDWKTSAHEGGDVAAFLDAELERYRGQLDRYARAMRQLEPGREVRAGLYFPLLDAWREL
jgi:ATP-dependent exoDNAse (exonuclease V) beta subunit